MPTTIDHERRVLLVRELEQVWNASAETAHGVPLLTMISESANQAQKPHAMLSRTGLEPVAALHWTEVISHATPPRVQALADVVAGSVDPTVEKALSGVDGFRVWTPIPDAFDDPSLVKSVRGTETTLRVELFGWMSVGMPWSTSEQRAPTLGHHLSDIGFPVRSTAGTPGRPILYVNVASDADERAFASLLGLRRVQASPTYIPSSTFVLGGVL